MIINALADFLDANDLGTVGEDLFVGELPQEPDECLSLVYAPSGKPDTSIKYYDQLIDIWGRYKNYEAGFAKLRAIMDFLHQKHHYEISHGGEDFYIYISYSQGLIDDFDRDAQRRHLFKVTIGFTFREA